jgi:CheY-like chemotaxis protein
MGCSDDRTAGTVRLDTSHESIGALSILDTPSGPCSPCEERARTRPRPWSVATQAWDGSPERKQAIANERKAPRRILVADDDPAIRRMLGRALSGLYEVVVLASDGDIAMEEIRRSVPDLVLLDLRMPVLDGWQVLERLEAEGIDVPVIVMSAENQRAWPGSRLVRARHDKGEGLNALLLVCEGVLSGRPDGP